MSENSEGYRQPVDYVRTSTDDGHSHEVPVHRDGTAPRGYVLVPRWILLALSALAIAGVCALAIGVGVLSAFT